MHLNSKRYKFLLDAIIDPLAHYSIQELASYIVVLATLLNTVTHGNPRTIFFIHFRISYFRSSFSSIELYIFHEPLSLT